MASRLARLAAAGLVLAAAALVSPASPARAAGPPGGCPDRDGVTVVVDFQELGGPTLVRCASGPQPTGLAALKNAGIDVTGTARWGEAFICRIEAKPSADTESCIDTPPASAYWSYWHAPDGGTWTYSQHGVTNRTPPPGSFEGWSFALDRAATGAPPPRVAPRRPPAPAPSATATRPPATATRPAGSRTEPAPPDNPPRPGPGAAGNAGPAPASPPPAAPPGRSAPTATSTDLAGPTDPDTAPTRTGAPVPPPERSDLDTAAARSGPGPPLGAIAGLGLLLALVIAAAVTARRRRASG